MGKKFQLIYRTNVTGLSHHNYATHAKEIAVGDELALERDESNRFDDEAIKIMHEHSFFGVEQIGWVAASSERNKGAKSIIVKLLEAGLDVRCVVISHDLNTGDLANRMYVGIFLLIDE